MIAKSRVKGTHLKIALISNIMGIVRNFLFLESALINECRAHSNHDFALFPLDNQVGLNFWKKSVQYLAANLRMMDISFFKRFSRSSGLLNVGCIGFSMNPIYQRLISICDFDIGVIVEKIASSFGPEKANEKTSFTIDNSCKICKFCVSHETPLFKTVQYTIRPYVCTA